MKRVLIALVLIMCSVGTLYAQESAGDSSILIVYYPSTRNNNLTGEVDSITHASGNTLSIAGKIAEYTGADIFEIDLVSPYSSSYNTVLMEAKEDQKRQARPEIRNRVENMSRYDTILLGYPNWWASIPMPIASFLEEYDLAGKRIIPFCSHGGGRLGQSISAMAKISPRAEIENPIAISYGGGSSLDRKLKEWLEKNGVEVK